MKETIIFLESQRYGTSIDLIKKASKLGYNTLLITSNYNFIIKEESHPYIGKVIYVEKTDNFERLKNIITNEKQNNLNIIAVISIIEENIKTSIKLNNIFGVKRKNLVFYKIFENKIKTREFLKRSTYNCKYYTEYSEKIEMPCIFKLPISAGSKDVFFIKKKEELKVLTNKYDEYIIEDYLKGEQFLAEIVVEENKILKYFVMKQDIIFFEKFIVMGYELSNRYKSKEVEKMMKYIIKNSRFKSGSFHIEYKIIENNIKIIEINSRTSGGCVSRIVKYGTNFDILKFIIDDYTNKKYKLEKEANNYIYTRYKVGNKTGVVERITGQREALKIEGILELELRKIKGKKISRPTSMGKRYAYVIAKGKDENEAKEIAMEAIKKITFKIKE